MAPQAVSAQFSRMSDVGGGRVPRWDMGGESVLKDKSLDHLLDLTFLFLSLFLPQMNWVSITWQV